MLRNSDCSHVSFQNVKKSYDGKTLIIDDLNLDVTKGEFVSLLGPSGSGKTTCLMMLAGFETVTSGKLLIDGTPVHNIAPSKRNIGMVFQNYALFPHMTVFENLAFPLQVRKMPKAQIITQVGKTLSVVRLKEFANRRISQLSGGQQQRVAVARAISFEPDIVLMDEPLGALDKNLREEMQFEIKHLHNRLGITIIYVTHDQSEAITMSDRVAVFNEGKVQQYSDPKTLYEKPSNAFVADFVGENNSLQGKLCDSTGEYQKINVDSAIQLSGASLAENKAGDKVVMSVRPEKIVINPDVKAKKSSTLNYVKGIVQEIVYMGDHTRLRLQVLGNDQFIVKASNGQSSCHDFEPGKPVMLGWRAQDCCVLSAK